MASLKTRLHDDLNAARKARDELTTATLRMVLSAVTTEEVAGKTARELSDDEVLKVLAREGKKRREAAEAFDAGQRPELAQKERDEAAILAEYLPEQLTAEEVHKLVTATIDQLGVAGDGMKAMGRVMGALQPQVKGRADGGVVAAEVKKALGA